MKQYIKPLLIFLALSTLINLLMLHFFFKPKRIAVIDMQSITTEYVRSIANKEYSDKDLDAFILKMTSLVVEIAKDNDLVILPKQAVFGGEDVDITEQFREVMKNAN